MSVSPLSARVAGAVAAPEGSPDHGVAWHYGDPLGEQRAAVEGAVIIDRSHRGVLAVDGDDRLTWLHTLTSQQVSDLADGSSAETLVLDTHGHVEAMATLTELAATVWLDTDRETTDPLFTYLQKMVFWSKVTPTPRPDMRVLTLVGPQVLGERIREALEMEPAESTTGIGSMEPAESTMRTGAPSDAPVYAAGLLPELRHDDEPLGFWRVMPAFAGDPVTGGSLPRVDLVVPEYEVADWWRIVVDAGARPAGAWAYDALRVAALRPRGGVDTDARSLPHELGLIGDVAARGAVHLSKGCYRGQETVSRVQNVGRPPRRLVLLHLDGSADALPVIGDAVVADGKEVGVVRTVVDHFELGPIALALVKRSVPATAALTAGPAAAAIDSATYVTDDDVPAGRAAADALRAARRGTPGRR